MRYSSTKWLTTLNMIYKLYSILGIPLDHIFINKTIAVMEKILNDNPHLSPVKTAQTTVYILLRRHRNRYDGNMAELIHRITVFSQDKSMSWLKLYSYYKDVDYDPNIIGIST